MLSASLFGLRWVDHLKPDMALAFFGAPSGVATWFWSHFFTLPYIVSLRGGDVPGFRPYDFARQHRILAPLLRRVWRRAAAVVANSAGLRKLGQAFEAKVPVLEIPNGVDLEKFQIGDRDWKSPRLLFVGRIVYQKGIDLLLLALAELREMPWSLQIVGDGPSLEEFRNQAKELGITNRVSFSGWQSRQDLPNTYRNANLFVNPSRHEGMPNTVLEAMSSGLPVLASRISGNEELVTEETGVLFPPEDSLALQNALRELLPNAELREKMGAAARKRVEAQYSWDKVAEAYLNLMNSSMELR
jgi:glycosyltransferase involved in cell wall biosynthesis